MGSSSSTKPDWRAALLALSAREWTILASSTLLLPTATICLKLLGYRKLERFLLRALPRRTSPANERELAFATARLVEAAARRSPTRPNCLARSLVLWILLRLQGVTSDVRFGFRRDGSEFVGHAWVERLGLPLNDTGDMSEVYEVVDFPPA